MSALPTRFGAWRTLTILLAALMGTLAALLGSCTSTSRTEPPTSSLVPLTWAEVRDLPGHAAHVGKAGVQCSDCHAGQSDASFQTLGEAACKKCHAQEAHMSHLGTGALQTSCLSCHAFAKPAVTCISCHEKTIESHAAITMHKTATCASCHNPHRTPKAVNADCKGCHAKESQSFAHGKFAYGVTTDAGASALKHDAGGDMASAVCTDCHAPHTPKQGAVQACQACHQDKPHGAHPSGHQGCTTCHEAHTFTRNGVTACATCHKPMTGATAVAGHTCTGCHTPHNADQPKTCTACHAKTKAFAAERVPAHADCTSCHSAHTPGASKPEQSCVKCHAKIQVTHAGSHAGDKAGKCIDCHVPHPSDRGVTLTSQHGSALACSACHKEASSDHAFHTGKSTCTDCHTKHNFPIANEGSKVCERCHANEVHKAELNKGHAACASCHNSVHATKSSPSCSTCHAAEATSAPAGHKQCQSCHEAHDGTQKANCATCHKAEAANAHAKVAGGCATCHRPHGPKGVAVAPTCGSCHTNLGGMHRVRKKQSSALAHADCATCHTQHGPSKAERAVCLSCHADRASHQPQAATCNGCHVFRTP